MGTIRPALSVLASSSLRQLADYAGLLIVIACGDMCDPDPAHCCLGYVVCWLQAMRWRWFASTSTHSRPCWQQVQWTTQQRCAHNSSWQVMLAQTSSQG